MHPRRFQNDIPAQTPVTSREAAPCQMCVPRCPLRTDFLGRSYCRAARKSPHQQSHQGAQSLLHVAQAGLALLLQLLHPSASVTMLASATRATPAGPWPGLAMLAPFLAGFGISLNTSCCFPRISLISSRLGSSSSVRNRSQQVPKASQSTLGRDVGTATRESRHEGSSSLQLCLWPSNLRPVARGNPKLMERTTSILLLPLKTARPSREG